MDDYSVNQALEGKWETGVVLSQFWGILNLNRWFKTSVKRLSVEFSGSLA
jgi:hypothetical protein